jgi:hypothetical protein
MTEILTESFCERCGTRYTFESARPRARLKGVRVLSRGLKNFVLSDDTSMDEAMAAARSETDRELTSHQLDAFHKTFNFCMSCRQYTCPNCWNEVEARCLSCAPHLGHDVLPAAFPDLPSGPLVTGDLAFGNGVPSTDHAAPVNGANGAVHGAELIGFAEVQAARRDEEFDAAARLAALTTAPADAPAEPEAVVAPSPDVAIEPPVPVSDTTGPALTTPVDDVAASPYDDIDPKTPSWLAKLVAASQTDEAPPAERPVAPPPVAPVEPPAVVPPAAAAPTVPAPVKPKPVAPAPVAPEPEPVAAAPVAPEPIAPTAPAPEPHTPERVTAEPAPLEAAATAPVNAEPVQPATIDEKASAQTSGLLQRFRPAEVADEAAPLVAAQAAEPPAVDEAIEADAATDEQPPAVAAVEVTPEPPAPVVEPVSVAPAPEAPQPGIEPPAPVVEPVVQAAPEAPQPVIEPPAPVVAPVVQATPEPPQPVVEPVTLAPAPEPPAPVAPAAPPAPDLAAAATATPAPADDVVRQPVWQMVAPDDAATPLDPGVDAAATTPTSRPEPQWPARPEWPGNQAAAGLPFLGRPAQPTGGLDALWAESTREVTAGRAPNGRTPGVVQPCVSCGLSLSATARFCRRCGTPQGG